MTEKTEKNKYFPSQIKYKKNNPTISLVLTKELKDLLDGYRGELSYGLVIKKIIMENKKILEGRTYDLGHRDGMQLGREYGTDEGRKAFEIKVPCKFCGQMVTIDPTDRLHMATLGKAVKSESFSHKECSILGNRRSY
jgi:hypothetical protein